MLVVGFIIVLLFGFYVFMFFKLSKEIYEVLMGEIVYLKIGVILLMFE